MQLQQSKPDGYTLAQIPLGVFRLPHTQKINWDPVKDISYIIGVTGCAFGVVVPADSAIKSWADFVAYARANRGKLSYGSTGVLTSPHLTMEDIAQRLGIELNHIPYKGSADLMQSIWGGQIMAAADSTGFLPQVQSGKLRVLNTRGEQRLPKFPDAPTLKELRLNLVQASPYGIGAKVRRRNLPPRKSPGRQTGAGKTGLSGCLEPTRVARAGKKTQERDATPGTRSHPSPARPLPLTSLDGGVAGATRAHLSSMAPAG